MQGCTEIHGADVAKDEVVVAMHGQTHVRAIANERRAIDAWLATLPKGSIIAMESTGIYHQLLAQRAHAAGMQVYVLNARDVHFYAKALGARGKTDRVDAGLIARYVGEHHAKLHAWQPGDGAHKRVEELLRLRATLVTQRESVRQAFKGDRDLASELKHLDQSFERILAAIEAKVDKLIAADAALATGRKRIASVTGFGPQGSAFLAVLFARIPFANTDPVVAYSGMDPRPNDSGKKRGTRKLSKRGPAHLRRQLYLSGSQRATAKH
jgi:transposase